MNPEHFKKWRTDLKLTQDDASKLIGLSRYTIQNWESAKTPIPFYVADLISIVGRTIKKKRNDFPVLLAYFDSDFWVRPGHDLARVTVEKFPSNSAMLRRVHELIKTNAAFFNASVIEQDNPENDIWNHNELEVEIESPRF